jgi:putative DNA primase/helicase
MVCKIVDHYGLNAVNLHLTFLTEDGRKASITPAKKVMPGKLPPGCAIRLGPVKTVMGVAEGIETAISAAIMYDMPVWACVNGTLLSQWIPPEGAEQITVFGDNDVNYTGQAKAYHLANRLEVQFKRKTAVLIPPVPGCDWNDFWQEEYGEGNLPKTHAMRLPGFLRVVK